MATRSPRNEQEQPHVERAQPPKRVEPIQPLPEIVMPSVLTNRKQKELRPVRTEQAPPAPPPEKKPEQPPVPVVEKPRQEAPVVDVGELLNMINNQSKEISDLSQRLREAEGRLVGLTLDKDNLRDEIEEVEETAYAAFARQQSETYQYRGPFGAYALADGVLAVRQGYVIAGGLHQDAYSAAGESGDVGGVWDWPSALTTPSQQQFGPDGDLGGIDLKTLYAGLETDIIVYMRIGVDALGGWFTLTEYPFLESMPADLLNTHNGTTYEAQQIIARVTLDSSGNIVAVRQHQYGDIYVPTFFEWSPANSEDDSWYAGWSHSNLSFDTGNTSLWGFLRTPSTSAAADESNGI